MVGIRREFFTFFDGMSCELMVWDVCMLVIVRYGMINMGMD